MIYQGCEKRRYKRMMKCNFTTKFRIHCKGSDSVEFEWSIVIMRNLSACGIYFHYTKNIELGTVLEFMIELPEVVHSIYCVGEVCRADELTYRTPSPGKAHIYGIAARFTEIETNKQEAINKFVEDSYFEEEKHSR